MATTSPKYSRFYTYIKPVIQNPFIRSSAPFIFNLAAIAIFFVFAIRPTISTIANLQKNIDNNQQILDTLNQKAKNLSLGKNNLESINQVKRHKIDNALPRWANVPYLIAALQNSFSGVASTSGMQIQPVTLFDSGQQPTTVFALKEVNFTFNIQGAYPNLLTVLNNLSRSPRQITVDTIVMSKQGNEPIILSINGRGFFWQ